MDGNKVKNMMKMANSLSGYIALLRQLALLCKVGSAIATAIAQYIVQCFMYLEPFYAIKNPNKFGCNAIAVFNLRVRAEPLCDNLSNMAWRL